MKTISTKVAYSCPIFNVEEREVENKGKRETHFIVVRQPNVTVLAINDQDEIIMVKQKRGKDEDAHLMFEMIFDFTVSKSESEWKAQTVFARESIVEMIC
jgi:hypothetical protein